jgi:hypothetical protein
MRKPTKAAMGVATGAVLVSLVGAGNVSIATAASRVTAAPSIGTAETARLLSADLPHDSAPGPAPQSWADAGALVATAFVTKLGISLKRGGSVGADDVPGPGTSDPQFDAPVS